MSGISLNNANLLKVSIYHHSIIQGIFPTQGLDPDLRHCRQIHHQWVTTEALYTSSRHCYPWFNILKQNLAASKILRQRNRKTVDHSGTHQEPRIPDSTDIRI